jgi:hypothetical protein
MFAVRACRFTGRTYSPASNQNDYTIGSSKILIILKKPGVTATLGHVNHGFGILNIYRLQLRKRRSYYNHVCGWKECSRKNRWSLLRASG